MAKRKVIWTHSAKIERKEILEYWLNRTQSKSYSIKLNKLFSETAIFLAKHPKIGRKTNDNNAYLKVIRNYLMFYEFTDEELIILSVWDTRRDEKNIDFDYT